MSYVVKADFVELQRACFLISAVFSQTPICIMCCHQNGELKLADFGLARAFGILYAVILQR